MEGVEAGRTAHSTGWWRGEGGGAVRLGREASRRGPACVSGGQLRGLRNVCRVARQLQLAVCLPSVSACSCFVASLADPLLSSPATPPTHTVTQCSWQQTLLQPEAMHPMLHTGRPRCLPLAGRGLLTHCHAKPLLSPPSLSPQLAANLATARGHASAAAHWAAKVSAKQERFEIIINIYFNILYEYYNTY